MLPKRLFSSSLLLLVLLQSMGSDSTNYRKRKALVIGGSAVAYTATMTGLYQLWYKDYPLTGFHFFNDNLEWKQMDKVGHAYSCYYEGVVGIKMMKWAGYDHTLSSIIGGSYGFFIQTGVEVLDGFSAGWGASGGDLLANTLGAGLVVGQSLAWDEQRIWMKYGFAPSSYAKIRPNLLGNSLVEQVLKDYNAQTYWLSINPRAFAPESAWPKWLNLSLGYGIDGFVGGHDNLFERDGILVDRSDIPRHRQWYIAPDIDLSRIDTRYRSVRVLLLMLNSIKFPLPALEYNTSGTFRFHPIKF